MNDTRPEKPLIVIVEDEPDMAEMFSEMMRLSGYEVIKCQGGTRGIDVISHKKPQAVILDLMMPDISGLDVLRYMRREPDLQDIPVIVVSAKSMPLDIRKGLEAGATLYLTKPVGFDELRAAVDSAVEARRAEGDRKTG
ncbi:MAG TPA: response regulator [Chloroflexi bacterium]|nr:response regulator [Chloroflexota bacterium]